MRRDRVQGFEGSREQVKKNTKEGFKGSEDSSEIVVNKTDGEDNYRCMCMRFFVNMSCPESFFERFPTLRLRRIAGMTAIFPYF